MKNKKNGGRKPLLVLDIGDVVDDLKVVDIIKEDIVDRGYKTYQTKYVMKCLKCGRTKNMLSSTIRNHVGTSHQACGKGIKHKDKLFASRYSAMRTRTTNPNYQHTENYMGRGINSDEFRYFIDFYDAMYDKWCEAVKEIGDPHKVSLERIDPNGNYTKENCTFIRVTDQQANTTSNIEFEVTFPDGHKERHKSGRRFALEHGLYSTAVSEALKYNRTIQGYSFKRIISPIIFLR